MLRRFQYASRRTFADASASNLKQFQIQSKQRMRFRKYLLTITTLMLPLTCLSLYDRYASLPEPLNQTRFPITSRFYIRKALWHGNDLEAVSKALDGAFWGVMTAGYGAASPQAASLVVYLSRRYINDPSAKNNQLEASFAALLHKPHVGITF